MKALEYIPEGEEWAFRVCVTRRKLAKLRVRSHRDTKQIALGLRRIFPDFAGLTSPELLERLRATELEFGPYAEKEALLFEAGCQDAGIPITVCSYTEDTSLLVDTRGPGAWLIEDDEESRSVIRDAIARGVRIEYI